MTEYQYTTREFPATDPHLDDEEQLFEMGWMRLWADVHGSHSFVVYRRDPSNPNPTPTIAQDDIPTLPPPSPRPYISQRDLHLAAYRVRKVLEGESVSGVAKRDTMEYRAARAALSALYESQPVMKARALIGKWTRDARRLAEQIREDGPELRANPYQASLIQAIKHRTEELVKELEQALTWE